MYVAQCKGFNFVPSLLFCRNRDIIDEENPYDAVTIEEDTKIYEDLVSYQKVVPVSSIMQTLKFYRNN